MLGPYDLTFVPYLSSGSVWHGLPTEALDDGVTPAPNAPRIWLWLPRAFLSVDGSLDTINQLLAAGWERIPEGQTDQWDNGFIRILGQLGDLRGIRPPGKTEMDNDLSGQELWAPTVDIRRIERLPVALGFTLDELPPDTRPAPSYPGSIVQFYRFAELLPPPQFGVKAMIFTTQGPQGRSGYAVYDLSALPVEAQELQGHIARKLRELVAPSYWRVVLPSMEMSLQAAADHQHYTKTRHEMVSRLLTARSADREHWRAALKELEEGRDYYDRLRAARHKLIPEQWITQWAEVRTMAQQLAEAYYTLHEQVEAAKRQSVALVPVEPTPKQAARKMPPMAHAFSPDELAKIASPWPVNTILESFSAARASKGWLIDEATQYPTFRRITESHDTAVQVRPQQADYVLDDATINILWRQVREYTDLDGDVFLAMLAQTMSTPPDEEGYVWINSSLILDYRGIAPIIKQEGNTTRRAGHRSEDMIEIARCVSRQASQWVVINSTVIDDASTNKKRKKKVRLTRESALTLIAETIRQDELLSPDDMSAEEARQQHSYSVAWRYRMGTWLTPFLKGPNRQMAYLCQQALRYDPYREQWEKRIARYLVFHLRVNAHGGSGQIRRTIGKLLRDLSLPIDERHPERTRTRFEKAMNRLLADRQIDHWDCAPDNPSLPARNWLETWLSWDVLIGAASLPGEAKIGEN